MRKISGLLFRVRQPEDLAAWYENVLGMNMKKEGERYLCKYEGQDLQLIFENATKSGPTQSGMSVYWKIGIGLPDVDLGRDKIMAKNTQVTEGHQFQEIGYLCHLKDPALNSLELLQDTFEKNFVKPVPKPELTLGQPGKIGQITIRSSNIEKTLALYEKALGMKMLSIQSVDSYGFVLYFLAFTDDDPPNSKDLNAVENREWLWQRPYTTLEIQYKDGFALNGLDREVGVGGMEIMAPEDPRPGLKEAKVKFTEIGQNKVEIVDHDGFIVWLKF
eukprot:TRINITY_DN7483_c0_g1_i2.p1 TRINITY_DN7483_c0_g1~~TRINITY_DN7483_c0_g1_i2.p1  ORF type:complete len:275 (-),score=69.76 TRINITY_DN7483_c0_g1_i2:209-1033(-)